MEVSRLSERDICTKHVTPALTAAGWTQQQFREEVPLTARRVVVRGNLAYRLKKPGVKGGPKRADYVLYAHGNTPLLVIEVKRAISVGLLRPCGHRRAPSRQCGRGLRLA
jgi:type I restriction enzyme R subunit